MDSWTEPQLKCMKLGGNDACNTYLQSKSNGTITARTPIKQKYDNVHAQLYKEILKARIEGRPEPTSLPPPKVRPPYESTSGSSMNQPMNSITSNHAMMNGGAAAGHASSNDPNGMERLLGETDEQYVARQTRLREEAKARMAAKFGSGGLSSSAANNGRSMQGIGSDSRYNPNTGGYGNSGNEFDVSSLVTGFGSVLGSAMNTAKSLADEQTLQAVKSTGASFWGGLTSTVSTVAASITAPHNDDGDGLAELQRQITNQKISQPTNSKYGGFGSDSMFRNSGTTSLASASLTPPRSMNGHTSATPPQQQSSPSFPSGILQEAIGLPNEDRNGIERLTGESDEQYVIRQTRLRDEAKARMAAKFGNGGLSATASSVHNNNSVTPNNRMMMSSSIPVAPSSGGHGNMYGNQTTTTTTPTTGLRSAPSSGNAVPLRSKTPPPPKLMNSNDFFSSFGS
jgi:ADP-ribosylation factor GTPase-activating protein 1